MLRDFYYSDDRRVDSAVLVLEEARGMVVSVFLGFLGSLDFGDFWSEGDLEFCFCFIFDFFLILGTNGGC